KVYPFSLFSYLYHPRQSGMKKIFPFLLLLLSTASFAQLRSRNDSLESYFRRYAEKYLNSRHLYTYKDLASVIDSVLVEIGKTSIPTWKAQHYSPYYEKDSNFRSIIDAID